MVSAENRSYYNSIILVVVVAFLMFAVWKYDAQYIIQLALNNFSRIEGSATSLVPKLFLIVILFFIFRLVSFIFIDGLMRWLHKMYHRESNFDTVAQLLKLLLWIGFITISLVLMFENAGTIITSLGLVGFGITFALQKPILNFVGWLTINLKGIYKVGDRIKISGVRGDVCSISLMNTELYGLLETFDVRSGKLVTVPNEIVLTGDVENYTKDTNYLIQSLSLTITYESDRERAEKLLYRAAEKVTKENLKHLTKQIQTERKSVEEHLLELGKELVKSPFTRKREIKKEMKKLEEEEKHLDTKEEDLKAEFHPRIRVALQDSAIELICQFTTPYDMINANKTRINQLFLGAIADEKKIEIAYPHMELVFNKTSDRLRKKLK